jgi:glycosyltransferase involved in cell wall biosynthesis
MNIALVINNLSTGGAETFICRLARKLAEQGHTIYLWQLFYKHNNHIYKEYLSHPNINEFPFDKEKVHYLWKNENCYKSVYLKYQLRKLVKKLKIDVVNSHLFESNYFIYSTLNIPHVISMHGSYEYYQKNPDELKSFNRSINFSECIQKIYKKVQAIAIVSDDNITTIPAEQVYKVKKIYLGYDRENGTIGNKNSIVTLGLLARGQQGKGWKYLLDSFLILKKKFPFLRLKLGYSASEYMNSIKETYSFNSSDIFWLENVSNVSEFYSDVDLTVFPSLLSESLPNTIIESLAFNIPVIATEVGDISIMLKSQKNELAGVLIEQNEQTLTESLIREIDQLVYDEVNYRSLVSFTEDAFRKFDLNRCAREYLSIFEKSINAST